MNNVFCTLFDSNYLDKGMVLYKSIVKYFAEFRLYIFAFDDKCYDILKKENLKNVVVISLSDFESEQMKAIKKKRTATEYCWTCTPLTIQFVLDKYKENICTYIDADMMFFSNADKIFLDLEKLNCSTIIVPHRYTSKRREKIEGEKTGYYCVEFNTFKNDKNGMLALKWWADSCIKWCHYVVPTKTSLYGDQKYLNSFSTLFHGVYICNNIGVGLAPWNDKKVKLISKEENIIGINDIEEKLIIYHYAGVKYITKNLIIVSSRTKDKNLHKYIFDNYVKNLVKERLYLYDKYGFEIPKEKRRLTNNKFINFYQKYIMVLKHLIRLGNVYSEKKLISIIKEEYKKDRGVTT